MTNRPTDAAHPNTLVRFFECGAADARERLRALAREQEAAGASVEALASVDAADLQLLVVRGGCEPSAVPEGVRYWRFRAHAEGEGA
jgi:hypothetical protein